MNRRQDSNLHQPSQQDDFAARSTDWATVQIILRCNKIWLNKVLYVDSDILSYRYPVGKIPVDKIPLGKIPTGRFPFRGYG